MKATFTQTDTAHATNYGPTKELTDSWAVVVNTAKGLRQPITARCYMGRSAKASVVYASVWINGPYGPDKPNISLSGSGQAGGYGYCKRSAALSQALSTAGVDLSESINGRGLSAIESALEAITRALGYKGQMMIVRN